jgi:hypothetical protein
MNEGKMHEAGVVVTAIGDKLANLNKCRHFLKMTANQNIEIVVISSVP